MQRLKVMWWLVAGIMGSVEFWLFQVRTCCLHSPDLRLLESLSER
jgi:hypothetical protein